MDRGLSGFSYVDFAALFYHHAVVAENMHFVFFSSGPKAVSKFASAPAER